MLLFSLLVAGSFSLGGQVAGEIEPSVLNAARFAIAALVVGAATWATGSLHRKNFEASWRYLLLGGLFAVYFVLMFEGLKTAAPVSAAAVFTLTPVMAALFGFLLMRQMMTAPVALGLAVGAAGALWVIFRADLAAFFAFKIGQGELIYALGCAAHAIYTPLVARLNRGENPIAFSFLTLLGGLLVLIFWAGPGLWETDWLNLRPLVWLTILYVAVAASSITFVLVQYAVLKLPASKVMAYTYLVPSWVILWEIALGQAAPAGLVLVGVGLTVLALAILVRDG